MTAQNRYTCLQLTNTTVRRIDISEKDGILSPVHAESVPIPESSPNERDTPPINALVETLRALRSDIKSRKVLVSISSNEVLLKRVELPTAIPDAEPLKQNAAIATLLGTENHIPVSLSQVAYDFHLMTETALLVGWMRRGYLETLDKHLAEAGIQLASVTPQPVVLANQLLSEWGDARVCGIHIDGDCVDLAVIEAGEVCLARSVLIEPTDPLIPIVQQTLANCPAPERVVLFQSEHTSESLTEVPVGSIELGAVLDCEVRTAPFDWARALCGPILEHDGSTQIAMNLLVPIHAKQAAITKRRRKQRLIELIPIAAIFLLLCANITLFYEVNKKKDLKTALDQKQVRLKTLMAATDSLKTQYTAETDALAQLTWGEHPLPSLATRLISIAESIPAPVRLTEIKTVPPPRGTTAYVEFDARKTVLLVGVANTQTDIDAFRIRLLTHPEFSTVRQVSTEQIPISGEKRLSFTLQLTSKGDSP